MLYELYRLYSELLEIPEEHITYNDNFYLLGGDSILALQLKLEIYEIFEIDIDLNDLLVLLLDLSCLHNYLLAEKAGCINKNV